LSKIKHLFNQILNKINMKKHRYFFPVFGFLGGMVAGMALIGLWAFTPAAGTGMVAISVTEAKTYLNNYLVDAAPVSGVIKGFTIDKEQFDAMNAIAKENTGISGFRIYMGKDNASRKIGIVVGIDALGKEAVTGKIYGTDSKSLSPCPPMCDVNSPISAK
jgi:hypothetical protein